MLLGFVVALIVGLVVAILYWPVSESSVVESPPRAKLPDRSKWRVPPVKQDVPLAAHRRTKPEEWAALLDRDDVVIVDTETTGLNTSAEILEVAIINTKGEVLLDRLVMPKGKISKDASDVHGLTRPLLKKAGAQPWPDVHTAASGLLSNAAVRLAYNARFDGRLLVQSARRHDLPDPAGGAEWECIQIGFADLRNKGKWLTLELAARIEGVDTPTTHRALADAQLTLGVLRGIARG